MVGVGDKANGDRYGVSAFNYPFQLTLGPVIGAIAAGNTVVIKPSEKSSNCAVVIQQIIEAALDPSAYTIVQGAIPETQALLAERWDKIFFTGSANVGRIIAKAAAPNLTPIVLELGGINPAIISKNADPRLVARRLFWPKLMNAGQLCTSQNYLLVERPLVDAVVEEFKKVYKEFYPQGAKGSADFSHIIDDASFHRIKGMIDNTKGKIVMGGSMDEKERFIEPTVVVVDSPEDSMITQESFGPLIPILPVDSVEQAVQIANGVQSTPLGLYPFGSKAEVEKSMFLELYSLPVELKITNVLQSCHRPAPAVLPSTTPPCTSPPSPSVVLARAVRVLTGVRPVSMSLCTVAQSPLALAGSKASSPFATRPTTARRSSSRRLLL